jgi:hypothetical protein
MVVIKSPPPLPPSRKPPPLPRNRKLPPSLPPQLDANITTASARIPPPLPLRKTKSIASIISIPTASTRLPPPLPKPVVQLSAATTAPRKGPPLPQTPPPSQLPRKQSQEASLMMPSDTQVMVGPVRIERGSRFLPDKARYAILNPGIACLFVWKSERDRERREGGKCFDGITGFRDLASEKGFALQFGVLSKELVLRVPFTDKERWRHALEVTVATAESRAAIDMLQAEMSFAPLASSASQVSIIEPCLPSRTPASSISSLISHPSDSSRMSASSTTLMGTPYRSQLPTPEQSQLSLHSQSSPDDSNNCFREQTRERDASRLSGVFKREYELNQSPHASQGPRTRAMSRTPPDAALLATTSHHVGDRTLPWRYTDTIAKTALDFVQF